MILEMSDNSSDDSSMTKVYFIRKNDEPDWKELYLSVNGCLFKTYQGKPISFHVNIHNLPLKKKYEDLICAFGGSCVKLYNEINNKTALLAQNDRMIAGTNPYFKVSYVIDCIRKDRLLNINDYVYRNLLTTSHDFMKIIFWETETFQKSKKAGSAERYYGSSDDDCNTMSLYSFGSKKIIDHRKIGKNTREIFTRNEKEAMLKFIISRQKLDGLRGDTIWKLMERKGICPRRTYQSMKNHFLKKLIHELNSFDFLSETEKKKLRNTF